MRETPDPRALAPASPLRPGEQIIVYGTTLDGQPVTVVELSAGEVTVRDHAGERTTLALDGRLRWQPRHEVDFPIGRCSTCNEYFFRGEPKARIAGLDHHPGCVPDGEAIATRQAWMDGVIKRALAGPDGDHIIGCAWHDGLACDCFRMG